MTDDIYNYASEQIITGLVGEFNCSKCNGLIKALEFDAFTSVKCPECGSTETVPARFCNFILIEILSTNPTRTIYRALDESINSFVVVKIMPASFSDDKDFIAEFRDESRAIAKLNHNNITPVHSFGVEKRQPYIAMEMLGGQALNQIIEENNGIPTSTAIRICYDISLGLQAAAQKKIVHKNINPANIILNKFGSPVLTGFGLIKTSHTVDQSGICGTPHYFSPEQIRKQKVEVRSNIYSLGATLYYMLVGKPPFADKNNLDTIIAHLEQCPPEIKKLRPEIPDIVSDIVTRMLQPDLDARYPSYKPLLNDLSKAMSIPAVGKVDEEVVATGKKHIVFTKTMRSVSNRHTANGNNVRQSPPPTVSRSKRILKQKKQEKTLIMATKRKLTAPKMASDFIEPPTSNLLADKEKMRKLHLQQKKRQRSIVATIITISVITVALSTFFILYKKHERTQRRIEFFALKKARENSRKIYNKISEDSICLNDALASSAILQNDIKYALQLLGANPDSLPTNSIFIVKGAVPIGSEENPATAHGIAKYQISTNFISFNFKDKKLPEIIVKALSVEANINELAALNKEMEILKQGAKKINIKSLNKTTSAIVKVANKHMRRIVDKSLECKNLADGTIKDIKTAYAEIAEKTEAHVGEVKTRRQAAIEAERQRLEAIRLEQERLAYEALVKSELNQVKVDHEGVGTTSALFASNDFKGIVEKLEEDFKSYQTDEGKKSAKLIIDRFNEMVGLKEVIIACINKYTFPWGWGNNLASRDIIKANEKALYVKNMAFSWGSTNVPQMLKFIDYYLTLNKVDFRSKAQLALGGAVFCAEYGKKGKAKSEAFREKAINYGVAASKLDNLLGVPAVKDPQ